MAEIKQINVKNATYDINLPSTAAVSVKSVATSEDLTVKGSAAITKSLSANGITDSSIPSKKVIGTSSTGKLEAHTLGISDITSLQSTLNEKAASSHKHTIGQVTDLSTKLTSLETSLNTKAPNYRHYRSGDSGRNDGVYTYYKLASFPIDNAGNSCSLTVTGRIGGWNNGNKGYLSMIMSNRDGISATGFILGNASLDLVDLVVYTSGTASAGSTAILYAKTYSWYAFDFTLGTMSGVDDIYDGTGSTATPTGTLQWSLSANKNKFLQIRDDGDVWKSGSSVALASQLPGIATSAAAGLVKSSTTGTTSGRDYNVQVKSDGTMKVNVPWTDTNTHQTVTDKNPTLAWGTESTVATIGSTDIHVTMPSNPNTHQAVTDKNATLAWNTSTTIATIGSTNINVKLPANPNTDTHWTTGAYVGATNVKANAATSNGATCLKVYDNDTKRAEFKISGSGATTVTSDASGNITISSTDTNTHQSIKSLVTTATVAQATVTEAIAGSGNITLHKISKTGTYTDLLSRPSVKVNGTTLEISGF